MPPRRIAVCLEATPKQAFASALDWPGWCRTGRDEDAALKTLASYVERDAAVAEHTEVSFPSTITFDVIERVPGGPATAFAAPECRRPFPQVTVQADRATVTSAACRRLAGLVTAAWATFDEIAAALLSPCLASGGHHLAGAAERGGLLQHARNDPGCTPHERVHQLRQARTSGTASTWPQS